MSVTPVLLQEDLQGSWNEESNLSIVIVRHPMSRLASVYYQKFVQLGSKAWANVCITAMHLKVYFSNTICIGNF